MDNKKADAVGGGNSISSKQSLNVAASTASKTGMPMISEEKVEGAPSIATTIQKGPTHKTHRHDEKKVY